jgi:hypothetical protein
VGRGGRAASPSNSRRGDYLLEPDTAQGGEEARQDDTLPCSTYEATPQAKTQMLWRAYACSASTRTKLLRQLLEVLRSAEPLRRLLQQHRAYARILK